MWRSVLTVLLLDSLLCAQQQTIDHRGTPISSKTFQPSYQTFTQRETIRRGTTEKAAIIFTLANDSFVSVVSPRNRAARLVPLNVEFDRLEGITVTDLAFSTEKKSLMTPQDGAVRVVSPNGSVHFKVKASSGAPLGDRVLKGKLKYQLVDANGPLAAQETEIILPVTVVEHDALAVSSPLYKETFSHENPMPPAWLWFALPVLIPLVLVMIVVCGIRGEDCSC